MKIVVSLLCMTKDGRAKIPYLLQSVQGFVDSAYFLDTGDGATAEWLENVAVTSYPIYTARTPFVDFSTTRNHLLRWAKAEALRKADQTWFLLLDDDMLLVQEPEGFEKLKARLSDKIIDGFLFKHAENMEYWITRLIRAEVDWSYVGITHECLTPLRLFDRAEGVSVLHNHTFNAEKFTRDLELLSADIARDPNDARTIFYLANTLRDMGEIKAAIRYFVMRVQMGGWDEEVYVAMYEAARLSEDPTLMEKTFKHRPTRAEPALWLRNYYLTQDNQPLSDQWEQKRAAIPFTKDILFVHPKAYGEISHNSTNEKN